MRLFRTNFVMPVVIVAALVAAGPSSVSGRWRYYDENGKPHTVDTYSQVPEHYRGQSVDVDRQGMSESQRDMEDGRVAVPKPAPAPAPVPVAPETVNGFRPAFTFSLPRLPTPSELFALDIATHTPHFSWGLLDIHQGVGGGTWNFSTVLLGLLIGGVAFFLIDKFKSAGAPTKVGIVVVAVALVIANVMIGTYADKLDSAVSLFNTARKMNGGQVAVASLPMGGIAGTSPDRGTSGVRISGAGAGGATGGSGSGPGIAEQPANPGANPFGRQGSADPKTDFEEMKRSMQEQLERASHSRDAAVDQVAK